MSKRTTIVSTWCGISGSKAEYQSKSQVKYLPSHCVTIKDDRYTRQTVNLNRNGFKNDFILHFRLKWIAFIMPSIHYDYIHLICFTTALIPFVHTSAFSACFPRWKILFKIYINVINWQKTVYCFIGSRCVFGLIYIVFYFPFFDAFKQ